MQKINFHASIFLGEWAFADQFIVVTDGEIEKSYSFGISKQMSNNKQFI